MSKLYKTYFDDELLNTTNDKYALKLLSFQLYEALMYLGHANFRCYAIMKRPEKEKSIKELVRKLNKDHYVDDEFVRFIDDVYEHKKLIVKTMKRLKPYTTDDVSTKVIKKTKLLIRELNEYTHNYYGSCSGCDTLQCIQDYDLSKIPDEDQVKEYMQLSLHLLQHMKQFTGDECLHCGKDTPLYCEKCYQDLISKNAELQLEIEELRKEVNEENKRCMLLAIEKQDLIENSIPKQVIRDKIEELRSKIADVFNKYGNSKEYYDLINEMKTLEQLL